MKLFFTFKRSYFRSDIKWIFGIFFVIFVWIFLSLFLISKIVTPSFIKLVIKDTVKNLANKENFSDQYEDLLFNAEANPEEETTFWGNIEIKNKEILSHNSESIKTLISERVYQKFYIENESFLEDFPPFLSLILYLSKQKTQEEISKALKLLAVLVVLTFGGLFIFSYSFGKLISLGVSGVIAFCPFYFSGLYLEKANFCRLTVFCEEILASSSLHFLKIEISFYVALAFIILGILGNLYKHFKFSKLFYADKDI